MTSARILIVEDEFVVALDIQRRLTQLGYQVVGVTGRGDEAVRMAADLGPDLVLMDIQLRGGPDGVVAAGQVRDRLHLPVVYLTAHADDATLHRASAAEPFGYILKPFDDRELRTVIEMALYKHRAERQLRASERRFVATLSSLGEAVIATDPQGRVTFLNRFAEALLGWPLHEATGRPVPELYRLIDEESGRPLAAGALVEEALARGATVDLPASVVVLHARDGRAVPIDGCAAPIQDDQGLQTGAVLVFRDTTEKRRADAELRRTQVMLERLFEQAPGAIVVADELGRIVRVNARAEATFDYRRDELLGRSMEALVPDRSAGEQRRAFSQCVAAGLPAPAAAVKAAAWGRRRDGSEFPAESLLAPVRTPDGLLVLSITTDQTERCDLEEQLRQAQKMEALGRLAGGVAHDFNNLLTVITGYSTMLAAETDPSHPWYGCLTEISRAGDRAADLTRQLLAFSRKQSLQPRAVDLHEAVRATAAMLRRLIGENIELAPVQVRDGEPLLVKADPGQLEQVIVNLAVNARDAMPDGGKLTLTTSRVVVAASALPVPEMRPGTYARLAVSDTGCGMDEATQARAFQPFYTTKALGKGTGLGLTTVCAIVHQCGGHIALRSAVGLGTTFTVYLPLYDEGAAQMEDVPRSELIDLPRGSETVLVVEDEETVRVLMREVLRSCGYTVLEARHGPEALELLAPFVGRLDLLVTDLVMPEMHGRNLAKLLAERYRHLKVLLITGYPGLPSGDSEGLDSDLLRKPFTPAALVRRVREVLDGPGRASAAAGSRP